MKNHSGVQNIKSLNIVITVLLTNLLVFQSLCLAQAEDGSTPQTTPREDCFTPNEITSYRPAPKGGDNADHGLSDAVEGGELDAHGNKIWGEHTFEDYHNGKGGNDAYVAVAMDKNSPFQGKYVTSPQYPGTVFKVVNNGGYGNGKTGNNWVDVAWTDPNMAKSSSNKYGQNGWATFNEVSQQEAQQIAANRNPSGYSGNASDYILPGNKSGKPKDCKDDFFTPEDPDNPETNDGPDDNDNTPGSTRNPNFALSGSYKQNPTRIYSKGVPPQKVYDTMDNYSEQNISAMDNGSCTPFTEISTRGHDSDSLKESWDWDFEMTSWGCEIQIEYDGDGEPIGELRKYLGCCDTYCAYSLWLVADEIEYRFPVQTRTSSTQIGDDPLRIHYSYSNNEFAGNAPKNTGVKKMPTPVAPSRTPGSGGGQAEGRDCDYSKASAIASQSGHDENYINWVMSIGERESGFSDKEANTNFYNVPANTYDENGKQTGWKNANVAEAMRPPNNMSLQEAQAKYGDYGYYQNNANDSQGATKYGLTADEAAALSNNGGQGKADGSSYTVEEQTAAMAKYIEGKYPNAAAAAKAGDYEAADNEVDGFWFAARKPNPCKGKSSGTTPNTEIVSN